MALWGESMINANRVVINGFARGQRERGVAAPRRIPLASIATLVFSMAFIRSAARSDAQTETVIKAFSCATGEAQNGCLRTGGVIARKGILYGKTVGGGATIGDEVVYALTPPSTVGGVACMLSRDCNHSNASYTAGAWFLQQPDGQTNHLVD